jgi:hypothetical protein
MSIITVQIGQCGNQIGEKLFETLISDCYDCSTLYLNSRSRTHFVSNHVRRLNENYLQESTSRFFTENESSTGTASFSGMNDESENALYARSVLIDMESKVVNKLLYNQGNTKLKFRDKNSYTQKKGSGNNWYYFNKRSLPITKIYPSLFSCKFLLARSYGYCINGPTSVEKVEDIFRKEAERCDRLASFFICMSLAGGELQSFLNLRRAKNN